MNMKTAKPLSAEMQRAIDIIKAHGSIVRYPGGFWQKPNDELKGCLGGPDFEKIPLDSIGTNTINALVSRELIVATDHRNGYNGEFPIKYELIKPQE